jgi:hypothetical protein
MSGIQNTSDVEAFTKGYQAVGRPYVEIYKQRSALVWTVGWFNSVLQEEGPGTPNFKVLPELRLDVNKYRYYLYGADFHGITCGVAPMMGIQMCGIRKTTGSVVD